MSDSAVKCKCGEPLPPRRSSRGMCNNCYHVWLRKQKAYGRFESIHTPADEARAHLQALVDAGVGLRRVSELSGVPYRTLQILRQGNRPKCHRVTAARVLGVSLPGSVLELADGVQIPVTGSMRRLQALAAIGYETIDLAARLGTHFQMLSRIQRGDQRFVTVRMARGIDGLFRVLQLVNGPSKLARSRAARNGWVPPLAWDENSIDDPKAQPVKTKARVRATLDDIEHLQSLGFTNREISIELGIALESLERRYARMVA